MPKCDFNKVACNFIEVTIWHRCSPVDLLHIFRTRFYKNTSGGMLLILTGPCQRSMMESILFHLISIVSHSID